MSVNRKSKKTEIGKICARCLNDKPLSEFKSQKNGLLGKTSKCYQCVRDKTNEFRKTRAGVVSTIYDAQLSSSRRRGHNPPSYSRDELREWVLSNPAFELLYQDWVDSGHDTRKKPSCDRINDYLPYLLSNIQLITWNENLMKSHRDRKNGVNQKQSKAIEMIDRQSLEVLRTFYSAAQASREIGVTESHVRACCRGDRKSSNGYYWREVLVKPQDLES